MPHWLAAASAFLKALPLRTRRLALALVDRDRRRALRLGVAVDPAHLALLRRLQPHMVIDVGANGGQFALACLSVGSIVSVTSFEPLSAAADRFERAIQSDRVELRRLALGQAQGSALLNVSAQDDSSSLREITELQSMTFRGTQSVDTERISVSTLDAEFGTLPSKTLLKIDVQGFELEVLRGGSARIADVAWIVCEVSFREFYAGQALAPEVLKYLHVEGFELAGIASVSVVQGVVVQADLLFAQRGAVAE